MSVGEFTASNIAMDQDKVDEKKKGTVDYAKLEAEIKASKELAGKVPLFLLLCFLGSSQLVKQEPISTILRARATSMGLWRACSTLRSSSVWQRTSLRRKWPAQQSWTWCMKLKTGDC